MLELESSDHSTWGTLVSTSFHLLAVVNCFRTADEVTDDVLILLTAINQERQGSRLHQPRNRRSSSTLFPSQYPSSHSAVSALYCIGTGTHCTSSSQVQG